MCSACIALARSLTSPLPTLSSCLAWHQLYSFYLLVVFACFFKVFELMGVVSRRLCTSPRRVHIMPKYHLS
jgi:hypothetical protein